MGGGRAGEVELEAEGAVLPTGGTLYTWPSGCQLAAGEVMTWPGWILASAAGLLTCPCLWSYEAAADVKDPLRCRSFPNPPPPWRWKPYDKP